jgi:hypothetical protein
VRNSSGVSYHVNLVVPTITNTGGGFWACPPADGCPTGSYHTQTATAYFGGLGGAHGTAGVTVSASGYPENVLAPVATETGTNCDPIFGDPNSPGCLAYYDGNASCSVMGPLNSLVATSAPAQFELATTLEKMSSTQVPPNGTCETNNFVTLCQYGTIPWCTAATSPPDLNPTGVQRVFEATYPTYWKVFALCERPGSGFAWVCFPPNGVASLGAQILGDYPLSVCTKHP